MINTYSSYSRPLKLVLICMPFYFNEATSLGLNIVLFEGLTFVFTIAAGMGLVYMGFIITALFFLI